MRSGVLDLVTVLIVGMLLFSSWALGGRASFALPWMGLIGGSAVIALGVWFFQRWREDRSLRRGDWLILVPWGLLLLYLWGSLQNPLYERMDGDPLGPLSTVESVAYLPGVVLAERAAPLVWMVSGVLVLVAAAWLMVRDRARLRLIFLISFINGVVLAVVGTFFFLTGEEKILGVAEPVSDLTFSSFRYRNHWAAYAVLHIALGLGLFNHYGFHARSHDRRGGHHWALITGCALIAVTIPLSGSRSGMLLLAIVGAGWIWQRLRKASGSERKSLLAIAGVVCLVGGIGGWLVAGEVIEERLVDATFERIRVEGFEQSAMARLVDLPQVTVAMALDRPWLGWGLGSYYYLFPKYGWELFPNTSAEFAHSDWLQWWAELGLVGTLLLLATPVLFYLKLRRVLSRTGFVPAAFLGIGALLLFAVWGFPFGNPAVFAHALLFFGLLAAYSQAREV